jgi:hypothetical protein
MCGRDYRCDSAALKNSLRTFEAIVKWPRVTRLLGEPQYGVFPLDREGFEIASISYPENKKQAFAMAKRDVQNQELKGRPVQGRSSRPRGEIVEDFLVNSSPATVKYA